MSNTFRYILTTLMKIIIVLILVVLFFAVGTMIGYGIIGDGKATDVFRPDLWRHITAFFK
ncbi:hypothetical protein M2139_002440 [Enterococcus sp. PF1-24]|uniref:DNA-directed RNA polymerase subunit beta n=1 Tax=unclassified Enterococcus TaxID=2608891 RepID=UPI00247439F6|nr:MULTISPECIES: DNA-directed RNA polymerase subunit beta [unclassified Enterococcus]MDH6365437.1 hypothetical protein [Enterococcus sp. PFB1-1]MDH6402538.1 hypothetical protein [Enterococcus sp. PF1-24]